MTQDWTEGSITYAARPTRSATATANVAALAADTVAEYDVTALVKNGTYNFSLVPDSTDGVSFNSRENSATTKRPQLVITTSAASGDRRADGAERVVCDCRFELADRSRLDGVH